MITMQALYTNKPSENFYTRFSGILYQSTVNTLTIWVDNVIVTRLTGVEASCTETGVIYHVCPNLILTFQVSHKQQDL